MLNGDQIKQRGLIQNDVPSSYRAASYDLTVGRIIAPEHDPQKNSEPYTIPPQGMVEVISAERVKLPADIAGFTTLKNSLCNQGILAISVGIIDPLYTGLMSSTLINFSKSPVELRSGDPFLRVTFHQYEPKTDLQPPQLVSDRRYILERKRKVHTHFSKTFLDLETTIKTLTQPVFDETFKQWKRGVFFYLPAFALLLGLLAFFMNAGTVFTGRLSVNREQMKSELSKEMQQEDYSRLKVQVDELRRQLEQKADKAAPTTSSGKP
jgi:deoxycytidine triphosphate deaminase